MKRIFTRTFFRFLITFVVILVLTFVVLVLTAVESQNGARVDASTTPQ